LKQKLGFDDPRFHVEDCDLCGNSAFREGYQECLPEQRAFNPAPDYPGYLQSAASGKNDQVTEELVHAITDQVMKALNAS
jgi:L-fuculose-phosphate aldolase